jgi:hypothetical protein
MLACCGCAVQALAFWPEFGYHVHHGYKANVQWPSPYLCPDRLHVRTPFDLMVQNGWRRQNLLSPHHFNEDCTALTTAGELKIRWIMTQAPEQYRQIFVERSVNPEHTAKRVEIAQAYASQVGLAEQPLVSETYLIAEGRPASVVDAIGTRFQESMPPPVLPAASALDADQ